MKVSRWFLAGVMVLLAVPVAAQSLGELAKKEAERRKAAPPATKTYTNEDLKKITAFPGGETGKDSKDAKDPKDAKDAKDPKDTKDPKDAKDPKDTKELGAKDEAYWRDKMTSAREAVRKNEMFRDALQTKINSLAADFTNRDDPYQRAQIADERQKAIATLAQLNIDIDKGKKAITELEDEARKAGVPPGWIR